MKNIQQWLDEYNESHRHPTNKLIHWICVPTIALTILGFFALIPVSLFGLNLMYLLIILALVYYFSLSPKLALGMLAIMLVGALMVNILIQLSASITLSPWILFAAIFIIAWIGQFIGHHVEGAKPSFFKDVQFLLIGPLWLLSFIYKKFNISY